MEWVIKRASKENINITVSKDKIGNVVVKVPASLGCENLPCVMLQSHVDMVCETDRSEGFDFDNNPIPIRIQDNGEWVDADGTTLGADNGIGVALSLGIVFANDPTFKHGPLEILLTVQEEVGLAGVFELEVDTLNLHSKYLLNLDCGSVGVVTIGCAGGGTTEFTKKITNVTPNPKDGYVFLHLHVHGLKGGHSGGDIDKPIASANVLISAIVSDLNKNSNILLCKWQGGTMFNAINRESEVIFAVPVNYAKNLTNKFNKIKSQIYEYYQPGTDEKFYFEPNLEITLMETQPERIIATAEESYKIISSINIMHHGVIKFSPILPNLVETSNNVAIVKTTNEEISVINFTRSSIACDLEFFRNKLMQIGNIGGWEVKLGTAFPGWKPEPNSSFIQFIKRIYEAKLGRTLALESVHGGLENGVIGAKMEGLQMISMSALTERVHTPEERVNIESVKFIFDLIKDILSKFAEV